MTPEEVVETLRAECEAILSAEAAHVGTSLLMTREELLTAMQKAATAGFRMGSNCALSMVKGSLLVKLEQISSGGKNGNR